ncbi:NAD-dependent epimerase/dehydratase family protein [Microbulbifer sp.]|uniref:NAD-dependent epimerase/dehydratase family protein n=1 Tax=Microbulbifer sp. TaxID=1908541 RepID=UPI00258BD25A|nr:NAD-dependent epimerase/dehydratase family protein [Microbulbifer sp.]
MRWVIIGSSGYIGGALCRHLQILGEPVISVSRREMGPRGCTHITINQFTAEAIGALFRPGDRVVYAAGVASSAECAKHPEKASWLNCDLPVALLRRADDTRVASFLYFSSVKARNIASGVLADETSGEPATDAYGASKWQAESALFAENISCRLNVIRPAAVFGGIAGDREQVAAGGSSSGQAGQAGREAGTRKTHKLKRALSAYSRVLRFVPSTGYRSVVSLQDLLQAVVLIERHQCDRERFIAAEPRYYDMAGMIEAVAGRRPRISRSFSRLLSIGLGSRYRRLQQSEMYSARRLRRLLNWNPTQFYADFLRGN